MPKISVIVPIHGTAAHLEKCLRSVMAQSLREIEILCIDDCSPDDGAAIVERLAAADSRIRLLRHDRNLGAGGARNTGIAAARAPFVAGVDSDDHILPEMMEKLWQGSEDGLADVVVCGIAPVDGAGAPAGPRTSPPPGRHVNDADQIDIFGLFNPSFCNKLCRRALFIDHGIRFPERSYYDDLATMPRVLRHAREIRVIPGDYYQYMIRDGSITHRAGPKHIIDYFKTYDLLTDFLRQEGLEEHYREAFTRIVGRSLSYHAWSILDSKMGEAKKAQYLRHMLLLKLGFLAHNDALRGLKPRALQRLLLNATGAADLPRPGPKDRPRG